MQMLTATDAYQTIPSDLAALGYRQQLCIDFSSVVVEKMTLRHRDIAGIRWMCMDLRDMSSVADKSVDVAFDKSTLDAMIHGSPWNPPQDVKDNTGQYLKEASSHRSKGEQDMANVAKVYRVLKDDGVFLLVTFRQPHFVKPLLTADIPWRLRMDVLGSAGSFTSYGFAMEKSQGGGV